VAEPTTRRKLRVATCSLAGCFGCHMSLLDLDERIVELAEIIELDRSPLDDVKHITHPVDVGLIEGGVCNAENVHVLREFRRLSRVLVAVGECALTGGVPAMRNAFPLRACLEESFLYGIGVERPRIPEDPELPLLLAKVHPVHEVVRVDYTLPGCPPPAELFWQLLSDLRDGRTPSVARADIRFD
jgi:NAD-reducing hydrogenase small subunit